MGSAPLHQDQPRSHHSPVQTRVEGADVHTSHCQPWGASGVNSQTPRPLLVRGPPLTRSPSANCWVRYAWKWAGEVGENVPLLSPCRLLTGLPPAPRTPLDRPQPPSKPVVQQEDVKARSVLLSWEPGSDGLSPVRYYTIQTRELPSGRWALHSASVSHNASTFLVDR